jgi:uncharacterized protein (DUF1778 family)
MRFKMITMKETIKTKMIGIKVTDEDHALVFESAKRNGFDTVTGFIMWLVRKHGK